MSYAKKAPIQLSQPPRPTGTVASGVQDFYNHILRWKYPDADHLMISELSFHPPHKRHIEAKTNGRHFRDDISKSIFLNENVRILIEISLKFVPKGPIVNIPALVQIMAWCRPGHKSLSKPMMVRLPTHICLNPVPMQQRIGHPVCTCKVHCNNKTLIMITTWHYQFCFMNIISILLL